MRRSVPGCSRAPLSVAFSPDGATVAAGCADGAVRLWDVAAGESTATLLGHSGHVWSVAFEENSDAGRVVLVTGGQDGKALLWDADAGRLLATRADLDGCGMGPCHRHTRT